MKSLKKIDSLILTSFFPPLVATFFIALFVLVMQTLWLYIDDIAGKGVGFFLMVELVGYMSVSMVPMALPVAVLISSVMVLGNLAERYELSSIKSAGVSLRRVMQPLMVVTFLVAVLSFLCSNYFIPYSNLKFQSRLYDIRRQKPTLSMEESVFNDDFQGFNIRIGDKKRDNRTITDILLYDDAYENEGRLHAVVADSGIMYGTADNKYFVMRLFNGTQYLMPRSISSPGSRTYPLIRSSFSEWTKVFDLTEFNLDRTDESLFRSHQRMMNNHELALAIDSINNTINGRLQLYADQTDNYFYFLNKALVKRTLEKQKAEEAEQLRIDSARMARDSLLQTDSFAQQIDSGIVDESSLTEVIATPGSEEEFDYTVPEIPVSTDVGSVPPPNQALTGLQHDDPWPQELNADIKSYATFGHLFGKERWTDLFERAKSNAQNVFEQAETAVLVVNKTKEARVKYVFEYHSKFSMAVACFIFLFIGAPMGAIVRKGGFGWPLLISIFFFMLFVVITIFSKNIAERFVIDAVLGAWMNCLIVFPLGLMLTYWAMRDTSLQQIADFFRIKLPMPQKKYS